MENMVSEWMRCPVCGNKTRLQIREDTELKISRSIAQEAKMQDFKQ